MPRERVLVTGGASGIGRAVAERCREDGYEPVVIDIGGAEGDGIPVSYTHLTLPTIYSV